MSVKDLTPEDISGIKEALQTRINHMDFIVKNKPKLLVTGKSEVLDVLKKQIEQYKEILKKL